MKKQILCCIFLFFLCFGIWPAAFSAANEALEEVTVIQLLKDPLLYEGKDIILSGEVIGQALFRNHGGWFHLMDRDKNVIGIWTDTKTLQSISFFGRYGVQGDRLTITGTYFPTWPEHGGDTGILLQRISFRENGYILPPKALQANRILALLLLALLSLIISIYWTIAKKNRQTNAGWN